MATEKPISGFPLITGSALEPTDLFVIVDVSNTSSSPTGTTSSVALSSVLNNPQNGIVTGKLVPIRGIAAPGQIVNTAQNGIVFQSTGGTLTDYSFLDVSGAQIAAGRASDSAWIATKYMCVSAAPSVVAGAASGSGATASVSGSDGSGVVTVNTGTSTTTGIICTLTFASPYGNAVSGVAIYGGTGGPTYPILSTLVSSTTLVISNVSGSNLTASTTYTFNYIVMGYGN